MSGILDDGDNVCAASGHVDQVTARAVGEFDGVDGAGGTNNVGNVGDGGTGGSTQVEGLGPRLDVDGLKTTEDTGSQLGTEGVPNTVLGLGSGAVLGLSVLDGNTLLVVDALAGGQVGSGEQILLATADNKDTLVSVGFLEGKNVLVWRDMQTRRI